MLNLPRAWVTARWRLSTAMVRTRFSRAFSASALSARSDQIEVSPARHRSSVRKDAVAHDAAFGLELLRGAEFVDGPDEVALEQRVVFFEAETSQPRSRPRLERHILFPRQRLVPLIHLVEQLSGTAALHAEVGLRRRPFDLGAVGLGDLLG